MIKLIGEKIYHLLGKVFVPLFERLESDFKITPPGARNFLWYSYWLSMVVFGPIEKFFGPTVATVFTVLSLFAILVVSVGCRESYKRQLMWERLKDQDNQ